jgi:phospholipid/cholesterol/gamma-HCH transport system substrate-binding protein
MFSRKGKIALAAVLVVCLASGVGLVVEKTTDIFTTRAIAYFENSNGIYVGDDVMILGVSVGKIDKIEPQPLQTKVSFSFDTKFKVPADAKAVIISPTLVTARAIQLTPAYTSGPTLRDGAVIPRDRTAVPVEFDDLRQQLEKLTQLLQPAQPGGVSTLGALVNTAADNLRGQGPNIRDAVIQLSQALSALADHRTDIFGTVKNLSILVTALRSSEQLLRTFNTNLASVSSLLSNDPNEVASAVRDLNVALADVQSFVADNREALGTTSDKLTSVTQAVVDSLDDVKQTLHIAPTAFDNFINIYEPATASLTGDLPINNFANPISLLCGAIQAASRLNSAQSAKLCVQYLAPIIKNRQYSFPPIGENFFVGAQARPNEITFSEDWLRPLTDAGRIRDYYEGPLAGSATPPSSSPPPAGPYAAEAKSTNPAAGLPGMMVPPGGGS